MNGPSGTPTGLSMVDLSKNVIDLAISTIKKTHSVTIATVPEEIKANLEVNVYCLTLKVS
jgi:hypothetical protein